MISRAVTEAIQKGMSVLDGYEIESATLSGKITEEEEYIIADITSFTVADEEGKLWGNQMLMIYKDPDQNSSSIPFGTINYEDYCPKDASAHFSQEEISTITKGHTTIDIDTLTVYHEYEAKINNKIHTLSYTSNSHSENSFEIYYDLMIDGQPFVWKEMETETSDDMEVIQQA